MAIGIASLAGMVSLGVGLQEQIVGRFTQSGMFDSITVMPRSVGPPAFGAGLARRPRRRAAADFGRGAARPQASRNAARRSTTTR